MKVSRLLDSIILWGTVEVAAMCTGGWVMSEMYSMVGGESIGRSITPATVLLSVAVAIVTQLWVKLNDLSSLASLTREERRKLWGQVTEKVRALVWLLIFFASFIFFVLACSALASSQRVFVSYLLAGVGAGFGACLPLLAAVLVDLNEVAHFRWTVEATDISARKIAQIVGELRPSGPGFESDEHLQGYKRVCGD